MFRRCSLLFCAVASSAPVAAASRAPPKPRRVVAWYQARPLDLVLVAERIGQHGGVVHCSFPPVASNNGGAGGKKKKKVASPLTAKGDPEFLCFTLPPPGASATAVGVDSPPAAAPAAPAAPASAAASPSAEAKLPPTPGAAPPTNTFASDTATTFVVFGEGSLVGWNAEWDDMVRTRATLEALADRPRTPAPIGGAVAVPPVELAEDTLAVDSMEYQFFDALPTEEQGGEPPSNYINVESDVIVLADATPHNKVPFSCALAQSVKLDAMNSAMAPLANQVKDWQRALAGDGELRCSLKQLRRAKTHLLSLVEYLNFRFNAQATPKVFWAAEFQQLRGVYRDACDHLEIEERGEALKTKFQAADESLTYLHDEVHNTSNELLTWVIIWLIAFEVFLALGLFQMFRNVAAQISGALVGGSEGAATPLAGDTPAATKKH